MKILYLLPLFACFYTSIPCAEGAFKRVCYLIGFNGNSHLEMLSPKEMRWHLCTHIIFAFSSTLNGTVHAEPQLVQYIQEMTRSAANRSDAEHVKFLFSVGGSDFTFVKEDDKAISRFIDSVVAFLKQFNLDGVDLDWEFPYLSNDKKNFTKLLKMIRARLDQESKASKRQEKYLLSVALTPIMFIVEKSYQVTAISGLIDFANIMTYDYHTPGTFPYTNYNAPLRANNLDIWYLRYFNVEFSAHYLHSRGLRRDQIIVGIPFYGYLYYLANPQYHGVYALCNGTQVTITFSGMCSELTSLTATRVFDRVSKVPYLYNGNKWISYDDVESVMIKSQWISDNNFGGSMTFALNYDDHLARCNSQPFPLQTAIYDILG